MNTGVSVIICCYNSEKRLPKVLDCLEKQIGVQELNWEVLIVDNASTDNTVNIVNDYCYHNIMPVRLIPEPRMGLSYARSTGIKSSEYEFICYIDDDNWVNESYISTVFNLMINHPDIGLCGGQGTAVFESDPPEWFDDFQIAYAVGSQGKSSGYMVNDINRLYGAGMTLRKSAWEFLENNGFTYKLTGRKGKTLSSGEDSELSLALQLAGYRLWYEPALTFFHYMPTARLSYINLKNLYKAFGNADVVIAVYHSYFRQNGIIKNTIKQNYLLCMAYNFYTLGKLFYKFAFKRHTNITRMINYLDLIRGRARTSEQLKMFGKYSQLVKSIGGSKWISGGYGHI